MDQTFDSRLVRTYACQSRIAVASCVPMARLLQNLLTAIFVCSAGICAVSPYQYDILLDERLFPKRLLTMMFLSIEKIDEFIVHWKCKEEHFFSRLHNHSVLIAFTVHDAEIIAHTLITRFKWAFQESMEHKHQFTTGMVHRYISPYRTEIFLQDMVLHFPRYFLNAAPTPVLGADCGKRRNNRTGRGWSLAYALYGGGAFSYFLIKLPILRVYDYVLKMDPDIVFHVDVPFDVGASMEQQRCMLAHSSILRAGKCEVASKTALNLFARSKNITIGSGAARWCSARNDTRINAVFFSNFMALATSLLHDKHVSDLATFLYEDWDSGYYLHRWTDQAPFTMFLCLKANITDLTRTNLVCDFSSLRNNVFTHLKLSSAVLSKRANDNSRLLNLKGNAGL